MNERGNDRFGEQIEHLRPGSRRAKVKTLVNWGSVVQRKEGKGAMLAAWKQRGAPVMRSAFREENEHDDPKQSGNTHQLAKKKNRPVRRTSMHHNDV